MKTLGSQFGLFTTIILLALNVGLASEPRKRQPPISVEQAIAAAKNHVRKHKIDVSESYIDSATLNLNPRGDRGPFWLIRWEPNASYSSVIKPVGGQVLLSIYMDRQIEVRYGE